MARTATWKIVTAGAALTGLGVLGAGAASAATEPSWATDHSFVAMDDSWDDTFWEDTYWDDTPYDD
ncbi:hypothetical protein [Mycobacterium sp. NAZ190054]|uniref:hypothetical protein n=1 Tax=Mycobacterium sp. NAZ190054 TaxID=1747766 RepID=UPI00079B36D7|nr:hypothetical protein [Mycobacterium sp. NAZ190054]KWX66412.1 hypothetical protein ASJ79_06140 [Mycobacterium sp. NAZ190054]